MDDPYNEHHLKDAISLAPSSLSDLLWASRKLQSIVLLQFLSHGLQDNFETFELSVKFLKEGQNREFNISLRRKPIKSNTKYDI
jgi:hypothetical protein